MASPTARALGAVRSGLPLLVGLLLAALLAMLLVAQGSTADDAGAPESVGSAQPDPGPVVVPERGFADRGTSAKDTQRDFPEVPDECYGSDGVTVRVGPCNITPAGPGKPVVVLWGDSHAWQDQPALQGAIAGTDVNLVLFFQGGCPPALAAPRRAGVFSTRCDHNNRLAVSYVKKLTRQGTAFKVVLGGYWSGYTQGYRRIFLDKYLPGRSGYDAYSRHILELAHRGMEPLFELLGRLRARVDVVAPSAVVPLRVASCPAGGNASDEAFQCDLPRWRAIKQEAAIIGSLRRLQRHLTRPSRLIDFTAEYCSTTTCRPTYDGRNTYWDHLHLARGLSELMADYFVPSVRDAVRANRTR